MFFTMFLSTCISLDPHPDYSSFCKVSVYSSRVFRSHAECQSYARSLATQSRDLLRNSTIGRTARNIQGAGDCVEAGHGNEQRFINQAIAYTRAMGFKIMIHQTNLNQSPSAYDQVYQRQMPEGMRGDFRR